MTFGKCQSAKHEVLQVRIWENHLVETTSTSIYTRFHFGFHSFSSSSNIIIAAFIAQISIFIGPEMPKCPKNQNNNLKEFQRINCGLITFKFNDGSALKSITSGLNAGAFSVFARQLQCGQD